MWYDEWLSWQWSQMNPVAMTIDTAQQGGHPPTYYAFLWAWTRLTMTQDLSVMRLPSVFFGVLAVALTYRLARLWFDNTWLAFSAGLVIAGNTVLVYFMRELRMYTLMMLLVTLSWWAFERFVERKRNGLLLYSLTLALMAYTYYFTGFIALLQFGLVLVFYRERLPRLLLVYAIVVMVLLPWLPSLRMQIQNDAQYAEYGVEVPLLGAVAKGAATQSTNIDSIRSFVERYTNDEPYVVIGGLAAGLIVGTAHYWRDAARRRRLANVWAWFAGTLLIFFVGNLFTPLYNPRYLLMIVPALGIAIGLGTVELPHRYRWLLSAFFVVFALLTHTSGFFGGRTPHNELLGTVSARFEPGDRVWYNLELGASGSSLYSAPEYYLTVRYTNLKHDDFVWDAEAVFADIDETPRVWDVRDIYTPMPENVERALRDGRRITERYVFGNYRVSLYEAPKPDAWVTFGDVFRAQVRQPERADYQVGEAVRFVMWMDIDTVPTLDYSLALHLRTADGQTVVQSDTPIIYRPAGGGNYRPPTSQWKPDEAPYVLHPELLLPDDLPAGTYTLWLTVYHWQDVPSGLTLHTPADTIQQDNFMQVMPLTVR